MADSGVEWLGEVPAHWSVLRFKQSTISCQNGLWGGDPNGLDDIECVRVADFDRPALRVNAEIPTLRAITQKERIGRLLRRGNLLLEKSGGGENQPVGQVVLYDRDQQAICSNFVAKVELDISSEPRFWNYQHHAAYAARINVRSIKQTSGIQNLDQHQYLNELAAFPPIEEQATIADYLDRATARIDTLVAKKTRFIELLREKRQALITHAVTKGLDASVPMKDSGVEWLGDVPAKWETAPLRVFLQLRRDIVGAASASTKLLSLTLQGVIERDLENPTGKMPATFDGYQRIAEGEMVFCLFDMDETPRTVGIAPQDGMITGAYTVFKPQSELWARYLYYFFLHVDEHKRLKPFYKSLRKTIRSGPFLSIQVPKPPDEVAIAIIDHLDRATARIDTLIAKTECSIELLREHRTALITAAVTGKIDLRDAAQGNADQVPSSPRRRGSMDVKPLNNNVLGFPPSRE